MVVLALVSVCAVVAFPLLLEFLARNRWILAAILVLSLSYTRPIIETPWGMHTYIRLDDIAAVLGMSALLWTGLTSNKVRQEMKRCLRSPQVGFWLAYVAWVIVANAINWHTIAADSALRTSNERSTNAMVVLVCTVRLIEYSAVYCVAAFAISLDSVRKSVWAVVAGAVFVGMYVVGQRLGVLSRSYYQDYWFMTPNPGTYTGPLSFNHAHIGLYAILAGITAVQALRIARTPWQRFSVYTAIVLCVYSLYWSKSVASWIAVAVAFCYLTFGRFRSQRAGRLVAGTLMGACTIGLCLWSSGVEARLSVATGESLSHRFELWRSVWQGLAEDPSKWLWGAGLRQVDTFAIGDAHNNYLTAIGESGLVGLVLMTGFLVAIARRRCRYLTASMLGVAATMVSQESLSVAQALWGLLPYILVVFVVQDRLDAYVRCQKDISTLVRVHAWAALQQVRRGRVYARS